MAELRRVLVFGRTGQLARSFPRAAWPEATTQVYLSRNEADFAAPGELRAVVRSFKADLVVIAAAYTAVDRAEREEALAHLVNAEAPAAIAAAAAERAIPVIHLSTDYVFDGTMQRWYREDDPVAPLGAYGRSKAEGERRLRAAN